MSRAEERLEALAIASYVAPRMRSAPEAKRKRRIKRLDKDGNVVGETTIEEIQKALLAKREIEFDVQDGVRPKSIACKCGRVFSPKKSGPIPFCCNACRDVKCLDCHTQINVKAWRTGTRRCVPCSTKLRRHDRPKCLDCGKELYKGAASKGSVRCALHSRLFIKQRAAENRPKCIECHKPLVNERAKRCKSCNMRVQNPKRKAVKP